MPPPIDPSRHLLFGLLALQNGLINQGQLVAAFQAWTLDKARALADHLVTLGHLDAAHRPLLEGLAAAHLACHGGDVEKSLAVIPAARARRARGSASNTRRVPGSKERMNKRSGVVAYGDADTLVRRKLTCSMS